MNVKRIKLCKHPLIVDILDRTYRLKQNTSILVCGQTGTGKSYVAMMLSNILDPEFALDKICFTPEEFLTKLNEPKEIKGKPNPQYLAPGSCLIFDEAGVGANARRFQQANQIQLMDTLQVFRHRQLTVFFTMPSLANLDKTARELAHYIIEMKMVSPSERKSYGKIYKTVSFPKDRNKEVWINYLKYKGSQIKVTVFSLPPKRLVDRYEAKAEIYKNKVAIEALKRIKGKNDSEIILEKKQNIQDIIDLIIKEPNRFCTEGTSVIGKEMIKMEFMNLSSESVSLVQKNAVNQLKKAGFNFFETKVEYNKFRREQEKKVEQ